MNHPTDTRKVGRPPTDPSTHVLKLTFTVKPEVSAKIDRLRSRKKLSRGKYLAELIEAQ